MMRVWLYLAESGIRMKMASVALFIGFLIIAHNVFVPVSTKMTLSQLDSTGEMRRVEFIVYDLELSMGNLIKHQLCLGISEVEQGISDDFGFQVVSDFLTSTQRNPIRQDGLAYKAVKAAQVVGPLILSGLFFLFLVRVRRKAIGRSLCFGCGYSLVGLNALICPECGKKRIL